MIYTEKFPCLLRTQISQRFFRSIPSHNCIFHCYIGLYCGIKDSIIKFFLISLFNFLRIPIFILILDRCLSVFCLNFKLLPIDQLQFTHVFRYITNKLSIFIQKIISGLFFLDFNSLIAFTFILQVLLFFFHLLDDLISDLLISSFDGCRGCRILLGNRFLIGSFCNSGISFLPCRYAGRIFCKC